MDEGNRKKKRFLHPDKKTFKRLLVFLGFSGKGLLALLP
jgi:hypothetical protein